MADRYACAVCLEGISDIPAGLPDTLPVLSGAESTALAYWDQHVGSPNDRKLALGLQVIAVKPIKAQVLVLLWNG